MVKIQKEVKESLEELGKSNADSTSRSSKGKESGLIKAKDILPSVLQKEEEYRTWRDDVEDYCEEAIIGLKEILVAVRKMTVEVSMENLPKADTWWTYGESLCRFLKRTVHAHFK